MASGEYQTARADVTGSPNALYQTVETGDQIPTAPFYVTPEGRVSKRKDGQKVDNPDIYLMFLFETENFVSQDQVEIQKKLRGAFEDFGRKIGMNALAVTLVKKQFGLYTEGPELDIERNRKYQKKFRLDTGKAPHIVILDKHPDAWKPGDKMVCLSLNRLPAARLHVVLSAVAKDVEKGKTGRYRLKLRIVYEGVKKWGNDHQRQLEKGAEIVAKGIPR